jgi:astacin
LKAVFTFIVSAGMAMLWASPKAPGTAALARAAVVQPGDEQYLLGIGSLRPFPAINPDTVGRFETSSEDGARLYVLRFSTAGAAAAQVYVRNMALPPGARLYLYGVDADGSVTTIRGAFEGAGPLESGEFWSGAIPGVEIVAELQLGEDVPASLPFEIAGLAVAEQPVEPEALSQTEVRGTRTSMFRGVALTHEVVDGLAIFEGDIELGSVEELTEAAQVSKSYRREAVAISGQQYRWPNGIIPYSIDPTLASPARVISAINHWNMMLAGYIKWVPRTNETAFVYFARAASASMCSSAVGRRGYEQRIQIGDYCSLGNVIHEMGHAVGLWHEQSREDRDRYVKILWENMESEKSYNFAQNISNGDDIGPYDYDSVMHYPAWAFSANGKPTIETIPPGIRIGQRSGLSAGDVAAVKALYAPAPILAPIQISITLTSNPTAQTIAVDGVNYTTPVSLQWAPGSVHTINALSPPVVNGVRTVFSSWSNGGAQTHTVVAPESSTTYTAHYTTSYSAVIRAAAPGTTVVSPLSADSFYASGSHITAEAVAPPGYCFTSWSGLLAGSTAKTTLSVLKPYSVEANFIPGSVTPRTVNVGILAAGTTFVMNTTATPGCGWLIKSNVSWITVSKSAATYDSPNFSYAVQPNPTSVKRVGTITVHNTTVTVTQFPAAVTAEPAPAPVPTYTITTNVSPAGAGTVSLSPQAASYAAGSSVALSASAAPGFCFTSWTGLGAESQVLIVDKNHNITANFIPGSVTLQTTNVGILAAGTTFVMNTMAPAGCAWTIKSNVDWITVSKSFATSASPNFTYTVKPNTTGLKRVGTMTVDKTTITVTQFP